MTTPLARYDAVAEFYVSGWPDTYDDAVTHALLDLVGPVRGASVLDLACGHGRISRELARGGAKVTGVDVSAALLEQARTVSAHKRLDIDFLYADASVPGCLGGRTFDLAVSSFGLSDIDDLPGVAHVVAGALKPGARFAFSILHPCFPGGDGTAGAWPTDGSYQDEGRWQPLDEKSSLRRQVGANHRKLSTYLNVLRTAGFGLQELHEPAADPQWAAARPAASRAPVYLVASMVREDPQTRVNGLGLDAREEYFFHIDGDVSVADLLRAGAG